MELRGSVMFLLAAVIGMPTFGLVALLPVLPGLILFWVYQAHLDRFRRPELGLFACVLVLQVGLAVSLSIATGPRIFLLPLMMVPVLLASVVFPLRVAVLVVVLSAQMMLVVGLGFDLSAVRSQPFELLYPLGIMVSGAGVAMVVAGLDLSTRGAAIVDPLTGLPNRVALRSRVAELEHQSRLNGRPVALIVADPDRFKSINDTRGHAVGDAVLREVGARIRAELSSGSSAYRLGGEEFVVLLGDGDVQAGAELADRLRRAISARAIEGLGIVTSFGVAASSVGKPFVFSHVFGEADSALYEAKRAGGNRVRLWPLASWSGQQGLDGAAQSDGAGTAMDDLERQFDRRGAMPDVFLPTTEPVRGPAADAAHEQAGDEDPGRSWERWKELEHAATGNWLVRDEVQRRQLLELNRHLREKARVVFLLWFGLGGLCVFQYGWQIIVAPLAMATVYVSIEHNIERFRRPEIALGLGWLALQGSFVVAGLLASAPMVFGASLMFMLPIGSSAVFPPRGVFVGLGVSLVLMVGYVAIESWSFFLRVPAIMTFYVAILITIAMVGMAVGRSTIEYRDLGIVDQLTGLFNRGALMARVAELAHGSMEARTQVAVIVADVDRFKAINDVHGHATGDAVLRELGYRVRKHLRAFESAYRIGGEEFVVLLEAVDWAHAESVAARLREAIRRAPLASVPTTVSFGLAASAPGERFRYEDVFQRADKALYEAKRAGGDRIATATRKGSPEGPRSGAGVPRDDVTPVASGTGDATHVAVPDAPALQGGS
ncbi:MAG: GGDEF domain-containing protein [Solirubrobacteraceae bacterium]